VTVFSAFLARRSPRELAISAYDAANFVPLFEP
jgi:hypothetical protein